MEIIVFSIKWFLILRTFIPDSYLITKFLLIKIQGNSKKIENLDRKYLLNIPAKLNLPFRSKLNHLLCVVKSGSN